MSTPIALPTLDSYWIREPRLPAGQLVAGEYPSAKDAAAAEIKLGRFVQFGITTFVDLTEEGEHGLRPYASDIRALAAASGRSVAHHRRPIPDLGTPSLGVPQQDFTAPAPTPAAAASRTGCSGSWPG